MKTQLDWKKDKHLKALLLIMNGKIRKDIDKEYEVHYIVESVDEDKKEHIVKRILKGPWEVYTCDCENCLTAKMRDKLKESPTCYHKIGVILFIQKEELFK